MMINVLVDAIALSDRELLARLENLATRERGASAELVAHIAALEARPALYAAEGFGSLFSYCTTLLRLSEDAACNRIDAARACRRFPVILDDLASGALTLTSVRLAGRHLTAENHIEVLARARRRTRREVEALVAELAPKPDAPSLMRRLPVPTSLPAVAVSPALAFEPTPASATGTALTTDGGGVASAVAPAVARRPAVQVTAPERYRVQFTIGPESHGRLRRLQDLLRREIPSGDLGEIFERAAVLLLEQVEKKKLAAGTRPRRKQPIRPGTDGALRTPIVRSRHIPNDVKRGVWRRDAGQCAYVAAGGRRCEERAFLELHHLLPYGKHGPATVANIALRRRRHNQYEAEPVFGPRRVSMGRPLADSLALMRAPGPS
jgi:hypothetical protein